MALTRRTFLTAAGAGASATALGACGFLPGGSDSDDDADTLSFTTWGTASELAGFRSVIKQFEQEHSGKKIKLNAVPYEQMFTNIDAQFQAGNPPDVFRVPYYTFGAYAGAGKLLDLSKHLPGGIAQRFTPAAWAAVQNRHAPYGVPHHTDTSAILFNKRALRSAGIRAVPTSAEDAWTWQEFEQVARKLRTSLPSSKYPFAYNWQGNGVTRWLSWLFQADGRFLAPDLVTPAIDSAAGRSAVDFTQSFFPRGLVPPNSSVKSTTLAADQWYRQTVAMTFGGAFLLPDTKAAVDFDWAATFSPRDVRSGGDFGGNALVATAKTKRPALAASFLDFVTRKQQMLEFCAGASLLPTRRDLVSQGIDFKVRPDLSKIFTGQAATVRAQDSAQVASPSMSKIITVLQDQLEQAFVGDQTVPVTLDKLSAGIAKATG